MPAHWGARRLGRSEFGEDCDLVDGRVERDGADLAEQHLGALPAGLRVSIS
jgi:hypothetical protein